MLICDSMLLYFQQFRGDHQLIRRLTFEIKISTRPSSILMDGVMKPCYSIRIFFIHLFFFLSPAPIIFSLLSPLVLKSHSGIIFLKSKLIQSHPKQGSLKRFIFVKGCLSFYCWPKVDQRLSHFIN